MGMSILLSRAVVDRFEEEVEDRYKRDKEAVRGMRTLLERYESGELADEVRAAMRGPNARELPLPPLEDTSSAQTLASKVADVCERFADEQWTMRRMVAYLRQLQFPLSDKPQGSISSCLGKLARENKLIVVRPGAGSSPSIYQWNPGAGDSSTLPKDTASVGSKPDSEPPAEPSNPETGAT